jgi:hypothetical protein
VTTDPRDTAALEQLARRAFAASAPGGSPRASRFVARVVHALDGTPDHWLVAALAGDQLLGWVRFTLAQALRGVSFLPHRPGQPAVFTPAADWIDADVVRARAAAFAEPGETAGPPLLSFDGHPDRVAWAVPLQHGDARRWAFVAGTVVWAAAPAEGA